MKNKAAVALGKLKRGIKEEKSNKKIKACRISLVKARKLRWKKK